jgi:general stress protein 26
MISKSTSLSFVREKINSLGTALFYSEQQSVLRLHTTVIHSLKVDELGRIWFFYNRPGQDIREYEKNFPARLNFFRKGINYSVQIIGCASIITDPEELNEFFEWATETDRSVAGKMLLLKLQIQGVDCFEKPLAKQRESHWWEPIREKIAAYFYPKKEDYRPQYLS